MQRRVLITGIAAVALGTGALVCVAVRAPGSVRAPARPDPRPVAPVASTRSVARVAASPAPAASPASPGSGPPTELPETPAVQAWLADRGTPDAREMYEYLLALNAHLDRCMAGSVPRGELGFWIHWTIDDDHVGRGSYEPDPGGASSGFDEAARDRLERCAADYLAGHSVVLPSYGEAGRSDAHWATTAVFPITDQEIYRVIAGQALPDAAPAP